MFNKENWEIKTAANGTQKTRAQNNYGVAIVRFDGDDIIVIKNYKTIGTFMADNKNVFRQREAQETVTVPNFETGLTEAKKWFAELTEKCETELKNAAAKFEAQAQEKSYKSGWVFHRMNECYGYELATQFVSK